MKNSSVFCAMVHKSDIRKKTGSRCHDSLIRAAGTSTGLQWRYCKNLSSPAGTSSTKTNQTKQGSPDVDGGKVY